MGLEEMFDDVVKGKALEAKPSSGELTCAKEDHWWKIRRGMMIVAVIPGAYVREKDVMFKALKEAELAKNNGG